MPSTALERRKNHSCYLLIYKHGKIFWHYLFLSSPVISSTSVSFLKSAYMVSKNWAPWPCLWNGGRIRTWLKQDHIQRWTVSILFSPLNHAPLKSKKKEEEDSRRKKWHLTTFPPFLVRKSGRIEKIRENLGTYGETQEERNKFGWNKK